MGVRIAPAKPPAVGADAPCTPALIVGVDLSLELVVLAQASLGLPEPLAARLRNLRRSDGACRRATGRRPPASPGRKAHAARGRPRPPRCPIDSQDPRYPGRAINTPGQCSVSSPRDDGTRAWVLNYDGFQIAVPVFTGAGQYAFPGALNRAPLSPYANTSTGGVGPWHTLAVPLGGAGSFTVADGLRSGTVSTILWAPGDPPIAKPLTVSGTWSCDVQGGPFPGLPIGLS